MNGAVNGAARPVLVVRPEPGASETAARLRAMGLVPLAHPLVGTAPTEAPAPPGPFAAVVMTSATAARTIAPLAPDDIRALPVHAIGERTARAARDAGFAAVSVGADGEAPADGAALGRMLAPLHRGRTVLYPCAEERRAGLEHGLEAGGVRVAPWPLYRTAEMPDAAERLALVLTARPAAVLLHAPSAARALGHPSLRDALAGVPLVCLSEAVADAVPSAAGGARHAAERPDETALLRRLEAVLGERSGDGGPTAGD